MTIIYYINISYFLNYYFFNIKSKFYNIFFLILFFRQLFTILCQPIIRFDFPVTKEKRKKNKKISSWFETMDRAVKWNLQIPGKRCQKKKKTFHPSKFQTFQFHFRKKKMERARANYPGVTNIVDEQCN